MKIFCATKEPDKLSFFFFIIAMGHILQVNQNFYLITFRLILEKRTLKAGSQIQIGLPTKFSRGQEFRNL